MLRLFDQFTRFLFFKYIFRKLIELSLIFCNQTKKKFFTLKVNMLKPIQDKNIVNFGTS